jgi:hypothetical protein
MMADELLLKVVTKASLVASRLNHSRAPPTAGIHTLTLIRLIESTMSWCVEIKDAKQLVNKR